MKKLLVLGFVAGFGLLLNTGCYYDVEEELYPPDSTGNTCDTSSVTYSGYVTSMLNSKCNTCHAGASPSGGISFETHADLKAYLDTDKDVFISSIVQDGNASNMPQGQPKLGDCEISKTRAWINAGYQNN